MKSYNLYLLIGLFCIGLSSVPAYGDLDAPHDKGHNISCASCHNAALPNAPLLTGSNINNFCTTNCHNAVTAPYSNTSAPKVLGHTSANTSPAYGSWEHQCLDCHDPHLHGQKYWSGSESSTLFLAFGQIDGFSYDEINNKSTLSYSSATFKSGWTQTNITEKTTSERRPIIIPNTNKNGSNFALTAIDATTMTVAGDIRPVYKYISPPTNFGIIYGQYINQYVDTDNDGNRETSVKFMDKSGTYAFTAGDGSGICEVCHTKTEHFRNAESPAPVDPSHSNITQLIAGNAQLDSVSQCTFCHNHVDGFRASCPDCHGLPPSNNSPDGPDGLVGPGNTPITARYPAPAPTGSISAGQHLLHTSSSGLNFPCQTCHNGGMSTTMTSTNQEGDGAIQIGFSGIAVSGMSNGAETSYGGQTLNAGYSYQGSNSTSVSSSGTMICANTYCHSDGTPITTETYMLNNSPAWDDNSSLSCTACHAYPPEADNKANSHATHDNTNYNCNDCHFGTTTDNLTINDPGKHVNAVYDLQAGEGVSFSYSYLSNGGRCSYISCHGGAGSIWGTTFDHTTIITGGTTDCADCHQSPPPLFDPDDHKVHNSCASCHDGFDGSLISLATDKTAPGDCTICHVTDFTGIHTDLVGSADHIPAAVHIAAPGSDEVIIFAANQHDNAMPDADYTVNVACNTCHNTELVSIHANQCATCHPSPYNTLLELVPFAEGGLGCQQGGCHTTYHADATASHWTVENDCDACHTSQFTTPDASSCANCHTLYNPADTTPPLTTSNALPSYNGAATIKFTTTDSGKVGIATTYYTIDDGAEQISIGGSTTFTEGGNHTIEFWSVDQAGNVESPKSINFTITPDTTPPVTTSNAQASYFQGGIITLSASDSSTQGVKATYYRLNDSPVYSGTSITLPTTTGTFSYTLYFWSEDWSGNLESENSTSFTVTSGSGTIRLVWWDCDVNPSHSPAGDDAADWTVRRNNQFGQIVASGSGTAPNWDGIDDISLPVSGLPYFVRVNWYSEEEDDQVDFPDIYLSVPGHIEVLNY